MGGTSGSDSRLFAPSAVLPTAATGIQVQLDVGRGADVQRSPGPLRSLADLKRLKGAAEKVLSKPALFERDCYGMLALPDQGDVDPGHGQHAADARLKQIWLRRGYNQE